MLKIGSYSFYIIHVKLERWISNCRVVDLVRAMSSAKKRFFSLHNSIYFFALDMAPLYVSVCCAFTTGFTVYINIIISFELFFYYYQ